MTADLLNVSSLSIGPRVVHSSYLHQPEDMDWIRGTVQPSVCCAGLVGGTDLMDNKFIIGDGPVPTFWNWLFTLSWKGSPRIVTYWKITSHVPTFCFWLVDNKQAVALHLQSFLNEADFHLAPAVDRHSILPEWIAEGSFLRYLVPKIFRTLKLVIINSILNCSWMHTGSQCSQKN